MLDKGWRNHSGSSRREIYEKKHDASFPINAIKFCLEYADITHTSLDYIVFYEDSQLKFERVKKTWLEYFPSSIPMFFSTAYPWFRSKRFGVKNIFNIFKKHQISINKDKIKISDHHFSHAASAYYPSPFRSAAVLIMDGVGEFSTTTIWRGNQNTLKKLAEVKFPNSIGLLYSTITAFLGFRVNSGEYKVMGLAPYGNPKYTEKFQELIFTEGEIENFTLNMKYFNFPFSGTMFSEKMEMLFGISARQSETELTQVHMDIAASLQLTVEELVLRFAKRALELSGEENLCLAGGVALNCVANGRLLRELNLEKKLWIQPASGDAGTAIGAALGYHFSNLRKRRIVNKKDSMKGSYLGPKCDDSTIKRLMKNYGAVGKKNSKTGSDSTSS